MPIDSFQYLQKIQCVGGNKQSLSIASEVKKITRKECFDVFIKSINKNDEIHAQVIKLIFPKSRNKSIQDCVPIVRDLLYSPKFNSKLNFFFERALFDIEQAIKYLLLIMKTKIKR